MIHPISEQLFKVSIYYHPSPIWWRVMCFIPFIHLHLYRLNKINVIHPVSERLIEVCIFICANLITYKHLIA